MSGRASRSSLLFAVGIGLALAVQAVLPPPERVARAIAEVNRAAGRTVPLRIEVELRFSEGSPLAGTLVTHPARSAHLEVRDSTGSVERHSLQGGNYTMTRDGEPQQFFHRLLPPLFLLQAASGAQLREQLQVLGADAAALQLGRLEDRDCYVLGEWEATGEAGRTPAAVSLWSDTRTHDPLRVFTREGVEYRLGPVALFDPLRLPAWIEVLEPGGFRARLELRAAGAAPIEAPPPELGATGAPQKPSPPLPMGAADRAITE